MTAPRLIRLVPTGVCHEGIEFVEPEEVQPLSDVQIQALFPESLSDDGLAAYWLTFARAIEQAHGIGRRMDA